MATSRVQRVDSRAKTIAVAAEPPINSDVTALSPPFRSLVQLVLNDLANAGTPFRLVERFRTKERQQWLYGSGRPTVQPFGRQGPILTFKDSVKNLSNHQGDGTPGSGRAADCYPTRDGKVRIPNLLIQFGKSTQIPSRIAALSLDTTGRSLKTTLIASWPMSDSESRLGSIDSWPPRRRNGNHC